MDAGDAAAGEQVVHLAHADRGTWRSASRSSRVGPGGGRL
jgi:hypothetical protein